MILREFHYLIKPRRIVDRDLRKRLPIQLAQAFLQAVHQLAVTQAARPAGGVDADDPQPAEHALAHPAIAEGVDAPADQRDEGLTIQIVTTGAKALGELAGAGTPFFHGHAA